MSKTKEINNVSQETSNQLLIYKPIIASKGYVKQYDCLLNYPQLDKLDRELYCVLLAYAEGYGKKSNTSEQDKLMTTISSPSLAKRLDCERTTLYRHISKLEELGIIKTEKDGKNKVYHILKDFRKETEEEKEYLKKKAEKKVKKVIVVEEELEEEIEDFEDFEDIEENFDF